MREALPGTGTLAGAHAAVPATFAPILLGTVLLLWPAALNGYPIVFADTGTYLSQAIEHYLGWDRPPFYSLFILPLHLTLTLWPVAVVQAVLAAHTLHLVRRVLLPRSSPWGLVPLIAGLSVLTWLPWLACQIMPDVFTPLLVLALSLLALTPDRLSRMERYWLIGFATFAIAAQQSSLLLSLVLLPVLVLLGRARGPAGWVRLAAPPLLAMVALMTVNLAGHGRLSVSPFGNVFLLARVIYDGPGMAVLRHDCPRAGWRLCGVLNRFPATSDDFLWSAGSPVMLAGGHKAVSAEADAIVGAALRAEPGREIRAFATNWIEQLGRFESGDGLEAWPETVSPWIAREFPPFEQTAYEAARQTRNALAVSPWLRLVHAGVGLAGIALCLAALRTRDAAAGFALVVLVSLLTGAAITGGLSTPHDRYQSRLMWLPPCIGAIALAGRRPVA